MDSESKSPTGYVDNAIKIILTIGPFILIAVCLYGLITRTIEGKECAIALLIIKDQCKSIADKSNFYWKTPPEDPDKKINIL